ncbi:glycosyltransferase family 4 protein [Viridibacterium curvum]|uniref:Glycosyltransferase family 4 protein n=1 Tax=Viridibacterium curvum TaxID=1101404 RepID=A0ABP9QLC0_9RHOO
MSWTIAMLALMAFLVAWAGAAAMRRYAISRSMLDIPNARSSHTIPTPRGGGVAFVMSFLLSALFLQQMGVMPTDLCVVYVLGGGSIALLGFRDDRKPVRNLVKLLIHLVVSAGAIGLLQRSHDLPWIWSGELAMAAAFAVYTLGLAWGLNLYNFMDGIDGLAVSEAIFLSLGGTLLIMVGGGSALEAPVLAAACLGFAIFNWPPARLFMGDAGSGFLGFVLTVIALASVCRAETSIWIWLILGGVFIVDATFTLLRRMLSGRRWYEAHRTHAYQHAALRWGHRRVTLTTQWINYLWLLPWALASQFWPGLAILFCLLALLPLLAAAIILKAGQSVPPVTRSDALSQHSPELRDSLLGPGH